jgi:hypothetical protein
MGVFVLITQKAPIFFVFCNQFFLIKNLSIMEKKPIRKLELKKKTVSRLSQNQVQYGGDSWTTIIYQTGGCVTNGCMTDFTRTISSIRPTG